MEIHGIAWLLYGMINSKHLSETITNTCLLFTIPMTKYSSINIGKCYYSSAWVLPPTPFPVTFASSVSNSLHKLACPYHLSLRWILTCSPCNLQEWQPSLQACVRCCCMLCYLQWPWQRLGAALSLAFMASSLLVMTHYAIRLATQQW